MTTDNAERIKACRDAIMRETYIANDYETAATIDRLLSRHFGESAPEQKEGNVATIYAEGRWIHARCLLCEWGGVRWEAKKGSHLPNAKAILQHALRDHLLAAHVGKFAPNPPCPQCEMEKSGEQIGLRHHECADEPLPAPSVDTNAERKPECEVRNINGEICGRAHATSEHAEWSKAIREAAAVLAVTPPADAPQEPTCAYVLTDVVDVEFGRGKVGQACGYADVDHCTRWRLAEIGHVRTESCGYIHGHPFVPPVVESSVLPSKSERE